MLTKLAVTISLASSSLLPFAAGFQEPAPVVSEKQKKEIAVDVEKGKEYSGEVEKKLKLSEKKEMIERVQRVGGAVAQIANRTHAKALWGDKEFSQFEYTFKVVEGKDVNAFSLPGGFIYVYEGLLDFVESDDELAGVMAHEVAHASLRHIDKIQREQSKLNTTLLPALIIAILSGGKAAQGLMIGSQIYGAGAMSGWSQDAERAADYAGFEYMRRSDYDATGILTVVERLAREDRNRPRSPWTIYQTHPPSEKRAKDIIGWMREANLPVRRSEVTTTFSTQLKTTDGGSVETWFAGKRIFEFVGADAKARAEDAVPRLNAFFDEHPELTDVQAAGSKVLGRRKTLIEIRPEDAVKSGQSVSQLTATTVTAIRSAVFSLGYQTWNTAL